MTNNEIKPTAQFLAELPDLDINEVNFAQEGLALKVIEAYREEYDVVIQSLKKLNAPDPDFNSYHVMVYDATGYEQDRGNCYFSAFWLNEEIKSKETTVRYNSSPVAWRYGIADRPQTCPGLDIDYTHKTQNLAAALHLCARFSYHDKEFTKEKKVIKESLSQLERKNIDLFNNIAKGVRQSFAKAQERE